MTWVEGVDIFRRACVQIQSADTDHGIQVFLRLPCYLQQAGKPDEAWRQFNHLLTNGYPNMQKDERHWLQMKSVVYDKMRLFLQREKKNLLRLLNSAVWLLFLIFVLLGINEHDSYSDREYLGEELMKLLKRAKPIECHIEVLTVLYNWANALPDADDAVYKKTNFCQTLIIYELCWLR